MKLATLFSNPAPQRRPRPAVTIDLDRSVPAWLLRGVSAAVVLLLVPVVGDVVVPLLAAAAIVALPHPGTVAALVLVGAGYVWNQPPSLLLCASFALVLHAVAVLARLTAPLPPTGRVEWRLVLRASGAFVVIQVLTQAMIGLSFAAMAGLPTFTWFAVLAVAGIGVAIVGGVRWVARHTQ